MREEHAAQVIPETGIVTFPPEGPLRVLSSDRTAITTPVSAEARLADVADVQGNFGSRRSGSSERSPLAGRLSVSHCEGAAALRANSKETT